MGLRLFADVGEEAGGFSWWFCWEGVGWSLQGLEEVDDGLLLIAGKFAEGVGDGGSITTVTEEGIGECWGGAIVEVGSGVGNTPERWGSPFVGERITWIAVGQTWRFGWVVTGAATIARAIKTSDDVVEEEVAVDAFDAGHIGDVADGAADGGEEFFAMGGAVGQIGLIGNDFDGPGQGCDEGGHVT